MAYNEQDYTWTAWTQPALTSDTSFGIVSVSSTNADRPGYKALDGIKNTPESCWESESNAVSGWLKWELPCVLKISQIKLYNKYTGNTRLSKNVAAYADAEKTIPIGTQQTFPQEPYSLVTITPETPVITSVVYINMIDTYNLMLGLSEIEITAEVGTPIVPDEPPVVEMDFNEELPFEYAPWTVTTWDGDSTLKGIRSNTITHNQSTFFTITAKLMYFKVGFIVSSETNYDKFRLTVDGNVKVNTGTATSSYEQSFTDGNDHTLKFEYYKDGSNSSGYDAVFINQLFFQTLDNALIQKTIKYLIQGSDGTLYKLSGNVLTALENQTLDGTNFLDNGMDSPPNGTWIADLPNAKVLYWQDTLSETIPKITAALNANPPNQIILTWEADMNHESILGINSMTADIEGYVSITLTFDHNATWWKYDGTEWIQTTQEDGMDVSTINAITTEQWANLLTLVGGSLVYRVSFVLDETSVLKRFDVDYINP